MAGGAGAFDDDDSGRMITEINVTPLVDIVLVLLIIFMVTATYIVNPTIKIDLPKAATGSEQTRTTLALTLDRSGALYLNGEKSDEAAVNQFIAAELPKNADLQAIIAADKVVSHGAVVRVIDLVKRAGVRKFAINVESTAAVPATDGTTSPATPPAPAVEPAAGTEQGAGQTPR
ncbi:MAG TPA: biopolymer transporter ExbD [Polyangia bacterium]